MGNNDRLQYQAPSVFTTTTPQVQVDDGTADYMKTRAAVFLNNANESHKRQLQSDLDMAQKDGERIGYNVGAQFRPLRNGSLFARSFNESGLQSAGEKISMQMQRKVKELSDKNPANPGGLQTQLKGWKEGYAAELPPELQTGFLKTYDKLEYAAVESAKAERKALDAQIAAAQFYEFEREMTNTVENIAPKAFSTGPEGDAAREALATIRQNYVESLSGNGPEGEYEVGGYKVKSAAGRSGAFSPLEIAKKITGFDNAIIGAGVYGNFQDEVKNGRGAEAYAAFARGDMEVSTVGKDGKIQSVKIADVLTNDEVEDIAGKMRTYIGGLNSIEEGEFRKYERGRERYNDLILQQAYGASLQVEKQQDGSSRVVGGDPVKLQQMIASAINDPMVKAETIDKLQTLAENLGTGEINNPMTTGETWNGIATGGITSYAAVPAKGINDETRVKMFNAIDQRNKGEHWSSSTRYRIAQDYADAVLAPEKSAGFSLMGDPNSASAADRAQWNKRMIEETLAAETSGILPSNPNAMPADGQFDFVARGKAIADEIAAKRKAPTDPATTQLDSDIKTVEDQMNNPKPGDDVEAVKKRYRELQDQKAKLQTQSLMGGAVQ